MGLATDIDILGAINEKVDVDALLDLVHGQPEKKQTVGKALKCFCPFHKGEYRTLSIDLNRKTFVCTVRACPGSRGGTLVDLWAQVRQMDPLQAALDLCDRFHLDVDPETNSRLSFRLFEEAETAFAKQRIEPARELVSKALELDPHNADARLLMAAIRLDLADREGAVEEYRCLARLRQSQGEPARAQEMLRRIIDLSPRAAGQDSPGGKARAELASLLEGLGDVAGALRVYGELCDINAGAGQRDRNTLWLEKMLDLDPAHLEPRRTLAEILIESGEADKGVAHLRLSARRLRERDELPEALEILARISELRPDDLDTLEEQAALAYELRDFEKARGLCLMLTDRYLQNGSFDRAEACLARVVKMNPGDLDSQERLAQILQIGGQTDKARKVCLALVDRRLEAGQDARALSLLERLRDADPGDAGLREKLAELYLKLGREDEAIEQCHAAADLLFDSGKRDEAIRVNRRIPALTGDARFDERLRAAARFARFGLPDLAVDEYAATARKAMETNAHGHAKRAAEEGLRLSPENLPLMELLHNALRLTGSPAETASSARRLFERYVKQGLSSKAEEALVESLSLCPDDEQLHQRLFDLVCERRSLPEIEKEFEAFSQTLLTRGKIVEAVALCRRVLELDPGNRAVLGRLASLRGETAARQALSLLVEMAQGAVSRGDSELAFRAWSDVLSLDSTNLPAHQFLADYHAERGEIEQAIGVLERLVDMGDRDPGVREKLAELYLKLGRQDEAVEQYHTAAELCFDAGLGEEGTRINRLILQMAPDRFSDRFRVAGRFAHYGLADLAVEEYAATAREALQREDYGDLRQAAEEGLRLRPENLTLMELLLPALRRAAQPGEAVAFVKKLHELYLRDGLLSKAEEALAEWLRLDPSDEHARHSLFDLYCGRRSLKDVEREFKTLSEILLSRGRVAEAIDLCRRFLEVDPTRLDVVEERARLCEAAGRGVEAREAYRRLARTFEGKGDRAQAVRILRHLVDSLAPADAEDLEALLSLYRQEGRPSDLAGCLFALSEIYEAGGDMERAIDCLGEALNLEPDRLEYRARLAELYGRAGQVSRMADEFLRLSRKYGDRGDSARAEAFLERAGRSLKIAKASNPDGVEIRRRLADVYLRQSRRDKATEELFDLLALQLKHKATDEALSTAGIIQSKISDSDETRSRIAALYEAANAPEMAAGLYLAIAENHSNDGDLEAAVAFAERAAALQPDSIAIRRSLAEAYTGLDLRKQAIEQFAVLSDLHRLAGNLDDAIACLRRAAELRPDDKDARERLLEFYRVTGNEEHEMATLSELADICERTGELEDAVDWLRRIIDRRPDDPEPRRRLLELRSQTELEQSLVPEYQQLIDVYRRNGSVVEATTCFDRLLRMDPANIEVRRRLVDFLLENYQTTRAVHELAELAKACQAASKPEEALAALDQALELDNERPELHLRRGDLRLALNDKAGAAQSCLEAAALFETSGEKSRRLEALEKAMQADPGNLDARVALLDSLQRAGRFEEALECAFDVAHDCAVHGFFDRAEAIYRHALEQYPEDERLWLAMIQTRAQQGLREELGPDYAALTEVYLKAGRLHEAAKTLRRVVDLDPDNLEMRRRYIDLYLQVGLEIDLLNDYLHIAQALERSGRKDEAFEQWDYASQALIANGDLAAAVEILRRLRDWRPGDERIRERLSNCELKRDMFKALNE